MHNCKPKQNSKQENTVATRVHLLILLRLVQFKLRMFRELVTALACRVAHTDSEVKCGKFGDREKVIAPFAKWTLTELEHKEFFYCDWWQIYDQFR